MKILWIIPILFCITSEAQDSLRKVNIFAQDSKTVFIGELGQPLGSFLTVHGVVVDGPDKGYEDGPNLIVHKINDSATQVPIEIPLSPYFGSFGKGTIPSIKSGNSYRLRVYETGEFIGSPDGAFKEAGVVIQTTGFYFKNRLIVLAGEKTAPLEWHPVQFNGREALLDGIAENDNDTACIRGASWLLKLVNARKWTSTEIGKKAEVFGKIQGTRTKNLFYVMNGRCRLVRLEDQLGKQVSLRGMAISQNQYWWFNYRGTDIYVEKMEQLPGWSDENHYRPMEITGLLNQEKLPRLDQISLKDKPDLKMHYIIRNAKWTPVNELLEPEWFEFR
ncbi:MAG: hypothetical protein J0M10_17535 [Chitinophagales bacterium]|nr:hypothetical protein [Chitinophagales bacterium]